MTTSTLALWVTSDQTSVLPRRLKRRLFLNSTSDKPDDPSFAQDFLAGIEVLKKIQEMGKKFEIQRDMVGTNGAMPHLRVVVPLFRKKVGGYIRIWERLLTWIYRQAFEGEEQELPDGPIEDDPSELISNRRIMCLPGFRQTRLLPDSCQLAYGEGMR